MRDCTPEGAAIARLAKWLKASPYSPIEHSRVDKTLAVARKRLYGMYDPRFMIHVFSCAWLEFTSKENFIKGMHTFIIVFALFAALAAQGIFIDLGDDLSESALSRFAQKAHGVLWCFGFLLLTMATFLTIILMAIASQYTDAEFQIWRKLQSQVALKFPILLGFMGFGAFACGVLFYMFMKYTDHYTFHCIIFCFFTTVIVPDFVGRQTIWTSILTRKVQQDVMTNTTIESDDIRAQLQAHFDIDLEGDAHRLSRDAFLGRFRLLHSELVMLAAERIYDDFAKVKLEEYLVASSSSVSAEAMTKNPMKQKRYSDGQLAARARGRKKVNGTSM